MPLLVRAHADDSASRNPASVKKMLDVVVRVGWTCRGGGSEPFGEGG
jgi:hypothetical protein